MWDTPAIVWVSGSIASIGVYVFGMGEFAIIILLTRLAIFSKSGPTFMTKPIT